MNGEMLGHYKILSQIGKGGMGEVYAAEDTKLRRKVALKVLPTEMADSPSRVERFKREAEAIAALNHPNIVTIFSVEEVGNTHFLTMELVEGKNLCDLIPATGMDPDAFLKIAIQIVEAVSAAHEKGIVHRDLKPSNIILSEQGRVKVLDFGLAKLSDIGSDSGMTQLPTRELTHEGMIVGTIPYMSPEQLQGKSVDHRTDIFSLGIIFYEMIVGARPFQGESSAEIMSAVLRDSPNPIEKQKNVSSDLCKVIHKCLEKNADHRLQTVSEILSVFRKLQTLPSGASVSGSMISSSGQQSAMMAERSIAVLPFTNMSTDPENEFFSDGIAEEIINALAQVDGLRVAARTSSFSFKGKSVEIDEIGRKLRVTKVLEGSVRKIGSRVRITVQLIDVSNGYHIWSERYDRELIDIFDVQDEIARTISNRLKVTFDPGERLVKPATENMEAYQLALKGRSLLLRRGTGIPQGTECFQKAVDLDPNYAQARAGLADAHTLLGYWGFSPSQEVMPKALSSARKSIELNPDLAEGHNALACAMLLYEWNYPGAEREFLLALKLNPNYTQARAWYALFYLQWTSNRLEEGITQARIAMEKDPLSGYASAILAFCLSSAGKHEEAIKQGILAKDLDPQSFLTHWVLANCHYYGGFFEESITGLERAAGISGRHPYSLSTMAVASAELGRVDAAHKLFEELIERSSHQFTSAGQIALAAYAAGEQEQAFAFLAKAYDERDAFLPILAGAYPVSRHLRADPRFAEIHRRLNLPGK